MNTITIMRYEGNGNHTQQDRYKEGENTIHKSSVVYTEEQLSDYMACGIAEALAPFYYSLIR